MTLEAAMGVTLGPLELDVALSVPDGDVVALLGPNGAGKSTVLRCLAGLQPVDRGRIVLDGEVLDDAGGGVYVPPERRPVGLVFQDYLLFPHLSALENVAFALRARGVPRAEARRRAHDRLDRLGLADHAGHRPAALSGGQAQRVALARALVAEPRLLLLDEPLAALDAATRNEVRLDLRRHLRTMAGARLIVTHDPVDAHVLADRVVVLERGRVVQTGTPAEVTARPRSRYVAELAGVNLLSGTAADGVVRLAAGAVLTPADRPPDGPALVSVRPGAVAIHRHEPDGSPRNVWVATVADVAPVGDRVRVTLAGPVPLVAEITAAALADVGFARGEEVWASVKATDVRTYPG
jgi:molybdate transport system ATP-binding protein